ncbi:MAG: nitroreductase family protein [Firmicutes bacterium]|nr:nitroreductase family protein [Bacillota bacterium]
MNYSTLIQNRKSVREFADKAVPASALAEIQTYHDKSCKRLVPGLKTELRIFGDDARAALEGAAGYEQFLVGAPAYLVLLTEDGPLAGENAGFIMEDLVLKLTEMDFGTCWLTFTDSDRVKQALKLESERKVGAIVAFGYGVKARRRLRINILSMSNVDISAKRHYFDPKRSVEELVFLDSWGNRDGVDKHIGFYDDMLWEAFYAASLSPSYLNRQAYGFVIHDGKIVLVSRPDEFNTEIDGKLSLGVVMLHFTGAAEQWAGKLHWHFDADGVVKLPQGYMAVAYCVL